MADGERWRQVLHRFAEACGAHGALLLGPLDSPLPPTWSATLDEAVEFGLQGGWFAQNPRMVRAIPVLERSNDLVTDTLLFTPEEFNRTPFQAEYADRFDLRSYAGFTVAPAGPSSVYISLERRRGQGAFEAGELAVLRRALPHIQRAGLLALNLGDARSRGVLDGLEMLRCGGILLDRGGRVVAVNSRAESVLARGGAFGLTITPTGTLVAHHRDANARLQRLLASALAPTLRDLEFGALGDGGDAVVLPRESAAATPLQRLWPLIVRALPLKRAAADLFRRAHALVLVYDPMERRDLTDGVLQQTWRLTAAESRVARRLGEGQDIVEIARELGVSESTVRSQLKAIFGKLGVHRQGELVSLLHRFAGP